MKPSIPKGTRDLGPIDMQKRQYIFDTIKRNFQLFGYMPIETPAMENLETLTGKYGDEGDKLIFKILNSGDYFSSFNISPDELDEIKRIDEIQKDRINKYLPAKDILKPEKHIKEISEKALRYDLTVPFARFVVMNQHNITFPFKRYQIQPVWRADRPQKGRYREFYQCDADVIGSDSLVNELELIAMMDKSFSELNIPVVLKINNRKILAGIAEAIQAPDRMIDIAVAIDKLDKIGQLGVETELKEKGFDQQQIDCLNDIMFLKTKGAMNSVKLHEEIKDENLKILYVLKNMSDYTSINVLQKGIEELEFLFNHLETINLNHIKVELDFSLARGLNYYTGTIFEAKANAGTFTPSILGGGRYDDLTGIFGLKGMSGVGISFGIDRIFDVMNELNLYPESVNKASSTKVLFANFGLAEQTYCLGLAAQLRAHGINTEVYPDAAKMKKQFEYADKKQIPFVCIVGSDEMAKQQYSLKNMSSGEQKILTLEEIIQTVNA